MKTLGNILWIIFGGAILSILWFCVALICFATILGIPIGIQCVKFASFVLYPFGRCIEYSSRISRFLINILWIVLVGWELAFVSVIIGCVWCITIVGLPFGIQSFKFAQLAIMPFGAKVVKV